MGILWSHTGAIGLNFAVVAALRMNMHTRINFAGFILQAVLTHKKHKTLSPVKN